MANSDEEKGFEVVDKRKVTLDEDGEVRTRPEAESDESVEEIEQKIKEELAGLPPADVYSMLKYFISLLSAQAWQWLGLVKSPITGQIEKDLVQAKVAIDTIAVLIAQMEGKLSERERTELQSVVSDLRINYVQQSSKQ